MEVAKRLYQTQRVKTEFEFSLRKNITSLPKHLQGIKSIPQISTIHPIADVMGKFGISRVYASPEAFTFICDSNRIGDVREKAVQIIAATFTSMRTLHTIDEYKHSEFQKAVQDVYCKDNDLAVRFILATEEIKVEGIKKEVKSIYFLAGVDGLGLYDRFTEKPPKDRSYSYSDMEPTPAAVQKLLKPTERSISWDRAKEIYAYWKTHNDFKKTYPHLPAGFRKRANIERRVQRNQKTDNIV